MTKVICNECGRLVEIEDGEEWGYCPFCENDQVEKYGDKDEFKIVLVEFTAIVKEVEDKGE